MVPEDLKYSKENAWCRQEGENLIVGITENGVKSLGDIVYVDLPDLEDDVLKEIPFGEIEGTLGVADLKCPVDGKVVEINSALATEPELLRKDTYRSGWLMKLKPDVPASVENLLSAADYEALVNRKGGR
jgi:glycine cleavage system H protein